MLRETYILEPNNVVCTLEGEGGGLSEKVYCLYTHEMLTFWDGP